MCYAQALMFECSHVHMLGCLHAHESTCFGIHMIRCTYAHTFLWP